MIGSTSPRTAILFRVYYGLLAVSIALSGALTSRHVATTQDVPPSIVIPAPAKAAHPVPSYYSGGINWGGRRR
jgi:hypothetical protein